jgi:hypothetical protein
MNRAYRVSDATWARLRQLADGRDALSAAARNTRAWAPDFNFLGLIGEALYGHIARLPMNETLTIRDGGFDFPGVDVKATPHFEEPRLLRLATDPLVAPIYFLVAIDVDERRARPVGYATRAMIERAPLVEYGHGPTRTLLESQLVTADCLIPRIYRAQRQ